MKKILLLSLLLFISATQITAQYYTNQNKVWVFGNHAGLDFTSGSPVVITSSINTIEGCASVCNSAGRLLFYTDGTTVYRSSGSIMPSGSTIVSYATASATQAALIVPFTGDTNKYYVFSLEQTEFLGGDGQLAYSVVDMSLDTGHGDVSAAGTILGYYMSEKMTAVAGDSCNVWLIVHRRDTAEFIAYSITAAGIGAPVVSHTGSFSGLLSYANGVIKVSPDRRKIVCQVFNSGFGGGTELYDFDPATGIVSDCQTLNTLSEYGAEFSPDNTKLYATGPGSATVQYDITLSTTAAIIASLTTVAATGYYNDLKTGPDGKIYIPDVGAGHLDCITSPNTAGSGCGYVTNAVYCDSGTWGYYGLPNLVVAYSPSDTLHISHDTSVCFSPGISITISAFDTVTGSAYLWNNGSTARTQTETTAGTYRVNIYNGCKLTIDTIHVYINPMPSIITGTTHFCKGSMTMLRDSVSGGVWASSGTDVTTTGSAYGFVHGVAAGTTTISYTLTGTGCAVGTTITVNPLPSVITGTMNICVGSATTLSDTIGGGTWSSGAGNVTVGSATGVVMGVSAGSAVITYTLPTGCTKTTTVVVYANPAAITGPRGVCSGSSVILTDPTTGGIWSSGSSVATVGSSTGVVTGGVTGGLVAIYYTVPATGCSAVYIESVDAVPAITGITNMCAFGQDGTITVADGETGGAWTSALVTINTFGVVSSYAGGLAHIYYTMPDGCHTTATLSVNPLPDPITGMDAICIGMGTTTLHELSTGGVWSSSNTSVATVGTTGTVTTVAHGTTIITYLYPATGCYQKDTILVSSEPASISGTTMVCSGDSITLSDGTGGGTWSSSNTSVATVGSASGELRGVGGGATAISYSSGACAVTLSVTVLAMPVAIAGDSVICMGTPVTLTDGVSGGSWSSSNPAVAALVASGASSTVTGASEGTAIISYATGSGASLHCRTTRVVTVNPAPAPIAGVSSFCGTGTAIFSDDSTGGIWSAGAGSGSVTVGSITGSVTSITTGTATITYTLPGGCSSTYLVTVYGSDTSACSPCHVFSGAAYAPLGAGGTIGADVPPGNYYVAGNVAITSNVTFTDAVLFMAPGITVSVNPTASLTLAGSHLFGGCGMWNGIVLLNNGFTLTGTVTFTADGAGKCSLIEDAITASTVIGPVGSAIDFVTCNNVIFNRNMVGLDIESYTSLSASYPFLIRNTVFTSRDFTGYPGYPYAWPQTMGTGGLKTLYTPASIFSPPFNIDNSAAGYTGLNCKNGAGAASGIALNKIGSYTWSTTSFGVPIPNYYSEIVIGDTTQVAGNESQNLFDNLNYGIFATNSNVTSVNNVFMNLWRHPVYFPSALLGGEGIYANVTNANLYHDRLRVYSPNGNPYHNLFYEFYTAVECDNYFQVLGLNSYMINTGPGTPTYPSGMYGWLVQTGEYDTVIVNNDTVSNVANGIAFWAMNNPVAGTGAYTQYQGALIIDGNVIQASPLGYTSGMAQNVSLAISVQNTLSSSVMNGASFNEINMNVLNDVERGIYVNNITRGTLITTLNSITLRPTAAHTLYYGINHTLCHGSAINSNYIMTSGGTAGSDSMRAIYMASTMGSNISCNVESNTGRGFEFFLQNHGTAWHDNNMTSNLKGYVLNGATIGTQHYAGRPMNNQWLGSTWSSSNPQTYVYHGANADQDTMFVSTAPAYNEGNPIPDLYSIFNGSIQIEAPDLDYDPCPTTYDPNHNHAIKAAERIARKQITYADDIIANNWTAQYEVWKSIAADPALVDSSVVIAEFDSMAVHSRYKYLTDLDSAIAFGDFTAATVMLGYNIDSMANDEIDSTQDVQMADGTSADYIVENYQAFYSLYMLYIDSALTSSDSLQVMALAQLCPEVNGNVVYQARALYSEIYNDLSGSFNDDSCLDLDTIYTAERHSAPNLTPALPKGEGGMQQYRLVPNPNNGSMALLQSVMDAEPVTCEIWDAVGRSIYKQSILFSSNQCSIQLGSIVPGLYLLQLRDTKGQEFKFKFLVE